MLNKLKMISQIQTSSLKTSQQSLPQAAVFVPLVETVEGPSLLFQVRAAHLVWQPGDICFPGGRIEPSDKSVMAAALRETEEELGLSSDDMLIYGELPAFHASIGVDIHPIVGEIINPDNIKINQDEVASVFTVPIDWLLNNPPRVGTMHVGNKTGDDFPFDLLPERAKEWRKQSSHQLLFYAYKNYVIWGLTAKILKSYLDIIA